MSKNYGKDKEMKVSRLIDYLKELEPDTEVWAVWQTPDELIERFNQLELTDDNDDLIEYTDEELPKEVTTDIFNSLDNEEYLWQTYNETFDEIVRDRIMGHIIRKQEAKDDTELWDKE